MFVRSSNEMQRGETGYMQHRIYRSIVDVVCVRKTPDEIGGRGRGNRRSRSF